MQKINLKNYETKAMFYCKDGVPATNFTLAAKKIIILDSGTAAFHFEVYTQERKYKAEVSPDKIRRTRFLRDFPVMIKDEKAFYEQLRQTIFEMRFAESETIYQTNRNGIQKVNGDWVFVYTNGSIGADGHHPNIYSGIPGFYLPLETVMGLGKDTGKNPGRRKEAVKMLFHEYNRNPNVFYPLFLLNLMSVTNGFFRMHGEPGFMKLTFWMDGASGSGKTELAKAAGSYAFMDEDLNGNLVSATAKRSYALENLERSSGRVFILDDVKGEKVRERKNSVRNIVDDCLRSIFQGRLTDVSRAQAAPANIDACALVTGEYMETEESQNARLMYLKVDGFLKNGKNSRALRVLQDHPLLLTEVCTDYIRWLMGKMDCADFWPRLAARLDEMRGCMKGYAGIHNAERLSENENMLRMAAEMAKDYLWDIGLPKEYTEKWRRYAASGIESVCGNTFALLGGEEMILQKALEKALRTCGIRKARYERVYQNGDGFAFCQNYFMLRRDDEFLYIENYEQSLLRSEYDEHEQYDGKPCLMIRESKLMDILQENMQEILKEYPVSFITAEEMMNHLPKLLKKMQIIYKQRRSDSGWGRTAVKYPVVEYEPWDVTDKSCSLPRCVVDFKPVIHMNPGHPSIEILLERLDDLDNVEEIDMEFTVKYGINGEYMDDKSIYRVRKAFMSGKVLYKG